MSPCWFTSDTSRRFVLVSDIYEVLFIKKKSPIRPLKNDGISPASLNSFDE